MINAREAAERAASDIIDSYRLDETYKSAAVQLLAELSVSSDSHVASVGLRSIFAGLVEKLNDSFDPRFCRLYDRIFAQIIDFYRRLPEAAVIDGELKSFGMKTESDLLARKRQIQSRPLNEDEKKSIRRVVFLSRITVGADVAITSVILQRVLKALPRAEAVLLGSRKLDQLFGGDPRVRVHEIRYDRGAGVLDRLNGWLATLRAVRDETENAAAGTVWVLDPDSRLTQLGLLPVCPPGQIYSFFESRSFGSDRTASLSALASLWSEQILNDSPWEVFPSISLPIQHVEFGRMAVARLRRLSKPYLIALSFGVGGNDLKRHSDEFEEGLLSGLLNEATVILDKGTGKSEHNQVERFIARSRSLGHRVFELTEEGRLPDDVCGDLVTFEGGIGAFAGIIAASDEYVGYDSAGQHIAAALSVPTLTIFVNGNSERFAERWRPGGRGLIEVLLVDANNRPTADQTVGAALALHHRLRK